MNSIFARLIICCSIITILISCDKDINDIGANIVGEDHFGFNSDISTTVLAYTQKTDEVQTNNLEVNQFGIFDNPTFGTTTASVGAEYLLIKVPATALNAPTVTSVVLDIPYFSRLTDASAAAGSRTYVLDSIIGVNTKKLKLSIFKSTTDLKETVPVSGLFKRYFSNTVINTIGARLNNSTNLSQNDEFVFDNKEQKIDIITTGTDGIAATTTTYQAPSMRINLDNSFGTDILALGTSLTTAIFNATYKGLYFKVEQSGTSEGCLAMMNFRKGTITINYTEGILTDTKTVVLSLTNNSVNVLNQLNTTNYNNKINNPNATAGDDRLYLKGGNGSIAHINLFGNTNNVKYNRTTNAIEPRTAGDADNTPDELDYLKTKGWLINEANIIFTIDKTAMGSAPDPNRILLYNANNKIPIIDYYFDSSTSPATNFGKTIHGGNVQKVNGTTNKYKIRVTNYIRNLINKDSTNVKLALAVNQNINTVTFGANKNAPYWSNFDWGTKASYDKLDYTAKFFPNSSIMNPLGTVLYGTNVAPADIDKKIKLEIWYTKPN